MKTWLVASLVALAALVMPPAVARAQDVYGDRLVSKDGVWVLPVATRLLGSTDDDHIGRGSINSWDLSAVNGTPVFAAREGVIEAAGCYLYENRQWPIMQGYGCAVQIKHPDGVSSQYGHCAEGSLLVSKGDQVTAETQLCVVGRTGVTSWSHTHFTILVNGSPIRIDKVFDINQMAYCKFCEAKNDPRELVRIQGQTAQQQSTMSESSPHKNQSVPTWVAMLGRAKTMPPNILGGVALSLLFFLFILKDRWRNLVLSLAVCGFAMVAMSEVPAANLKASTAQAQAETEAQEISVALPSEYAQNSDAQAVAKLWGKHRDLIVQLGKETGIPISAIVGTLITESRGVGIVNGRLKIRLETHQFKKFLGNDNLFNKHFQIPCCGRDRFLIAHYWNGSGWVSVHDGQDNEWAAFQIALSLNGDAAYRSLSMGAPQIFGDNYSMFGYGSAKEMFDDMSSSERVQLVNMFRYIAQVGHIKSLQTGNYEAFVANYNGPGNVPTYTALVRKYEAVFKQLHNQGLLQ